MKRSADFWRKHGETKYRQLFETNRDGIYISTTDGVVIDVNQAALEITGYKSREEFSRLNTTKHYVDPEDRKKFQREIKRRGYVQDYEVRLRKKNGSIVYCLLTSSALKSDDNTLIGYQGIIRDITKWKIAEATLRKSEKRFKDADVKLQKSHKQLRKLATHLQNVKEEESKRIARDLHDSLGQILTVLKIDISLLHKQLLNPSMFKGNIKALSDKTKSMLDNLDATMKSIRRISTNLRPVILDDMGLIPAIEWLAEDFHASSGIEFNLKVTAKEKDVEPIPIAITIFRILQEAFTNIIRHANATKVFVHLYKRKSELILKVSDNGKGITGNRMKNTNTYGLLGMQERTISLGGVFNIKNKNGTEISIKIPVPIQHQIFNRKTDN